MISWSIFLWEKFFEDSIFDWPENHKFADVPVQSQSILKGMRNRIANELFEILKKKMKSPQMAAERLKKLLDYVQFMKVKV